MPPPYPSWRHFLGLQDEEALYGGWVGRWERAGLDWTGRQGFVFVSLFVSCVTQAGLDLTLFLNKNHHATPTKPPTTGLSHDPRGHQSLRHRAALLPHQGSRGPPRRAGGGGG